MKPTAAGRFTVLRSVLRVCLLFAAVRAVPAEPTTPPRTTPPETKDVEFLNSSYTYNLPMPLYSLHLIGAANPIIAVSSRKNCGVTVSFDPAEDARKHFVLVPIVDPLDDLKTRVQIYAADAMDFDEYSFTLLAKTAKRETAVRTSVTILADKAESVPRFSRQLYTADLRSYDDSKAQKNRIPLRFEQGDVALTRGQVRGEDFSASGISKENLKVYSSAKDLTVKVELVNVTEEFLQQDFVDVILKAKQGAATAQTVVQILLPGKKEANAPEAQESQEVIVPEASNGYMIATIILSLFITTTIVAYAVYSTFYKRR